MGNWSTSVNVAGVQPFEPGGKRLPEGVYAVTIKDSDQKASKDPSKSPSLVFAVAVTEAGEFKGVERLVFVNMNWAEEFHRKHMKALLLSLGAQPAALEGGNLDLNQSMFNGKQAFIFVQTRDGEVDGKKVYDNVNFITQEFYAKYKSERGVTGATPAASNGAATGLAGLAGAAPAPAKTGGSIFGS
jgi:hypothetical protein